MVLSPLQLPAWLPRPSDVEIAFLTAYPSMVVRQKQIKAEYQSDALAVQRLLNAGQAVPSEVRTSLLKRLQLITAADKRLGEIGAGIRKAIDTAKRFNLLSDDDAKQAGLGAIPVAFVVIIIAGMLIAGGVMALYLTGLRDVKLAQDQIAAQREVVAAFVERIKATPIDQDVRVPEQILPQSRQMDVPGRGVLDSLFSSFGISAGLGTVLLIGVGLYVLMNNRRRAA